MANHKSAIHESILNLVGAAGPTGLTASELLPTLAAHGWGSAQTLRKRLVTLQREGKLVRQYQYRTQGLGGEYVYWTPKFAPPEVGNG